MRHHSCNATVALVLLIIATQLFPLPIATAAAHPGKRTASKAPLTIALDPGHGGPDSGALHYNAQGVVDLEEKTVTLSTALFLAADLQAAGYRVVLTRTTDTAVNLPPRDLNGDHQIDNHDELQARVNIINASRAVLFVSLHDNAHSDPSVEGPMTIYSSSRHFAAKSSLLATLCHLTLLRAFADQGVKVQDQGVIDENLETVSPYHYFLLGPTSPFTSHPTQVPGIIAESLFVTNDGDAQLLAQTRTRKLIAAAYAEGIISYLQAARVQG